MSLEELKDKLRKATKIAEEISSELEEEYRLQAFIKILDVLIAAMGIQTIQPTITLKTIKKKIALTEFVATLKLRTNPERMTALAYYLSIYEGRTEFSRKELLELWKEVAWKMPGNPDRDLKIAIRKGWLSKSNKPGKYYLTDKGRKYIESLIEEAGQEDLK